MWFLYFYFLFFFTFPFFAAESFPYLPFTAKRLLDKKFGRSAKTQTNYRQSVLTKILTRVNNGTPVGQETRLGRFANNIADHNGYNS